STPQSVYTEIFVSKLAVAAPLGSTFGHVVAVTSRPLPTNRYQRPGAVLVKPWHVGALSKVAKVVSPLTSAGRVMGWASTQRSLAGGWQSMEGSFVTESVKLPLAPFAPCTKIRYSTPGSAQKRIV